ncbi:MAG: 8-amino-7-oxononanoate synthase [Candidatus Omnitrophica bacterium]|nr:8-amino-7-oxononanoate synthase [Candidatus Omnitrophota bacterium]
MEFIEKELEAIKKEGLYRSLRPVDGHQGAHITIDGKECLNLCSNNYLGLASHPKLKQAAVEAIQKYGVGAGASRLVCGNLKFYGELENRLAKFKKQEACLVFNSGYMANLGAITALVGRGDIVFSDKLNHASIVDAILLSRAELKRYPHKDMSALEGMLKDHRPCTIDHGQRKLIITDSLFSMDGDIAPLSDIVDLARQYGAMVMVDEAHATGIFGETGSGLSEHFGLGHEIDMHMGTLSKAFGCVGGYVAGKKELIELLINKSRALIYTTAMTPPSLASALAALDIIQKERWMAKVLLENAAFLRRGLIDMGFKLASSESQIIPILTGPSDMAVAFSRALFDEGIFIQAIRPPTVPEGSARLRLTVMATHKKQDLEMALEIIAATARRLGIAG